MISNSVEGGEKRANERINRGETARKEPDVVRAELNNTGVGKGQQKAPVPYGKT